MSTEVSHISLTRKFLTVLAKNPNFELTLEYDNYSIKIKGADIKKSGK